VARTSPKRKVTLYFNSGMLAETQREAIRQDRSISWIIQAAWKIARPEIRRLPGAGGVLPPPSATQAAEPVRQEAPPVAAVARRAARD
jgi:uncharacterized small protein (TIGR04563 family)